MNRRSTLKYRERSLFWRTIERPSSDCSTSQEKPSAKFISEVAPQDNDIHSKNNAQYYAASSTQGVHPLVDLATNTRLRSYEERIKAGFDGIKDIADSCAVNQKRNDFFDWSQQILQQKVGIRFNRQEWADINLNGFDLNKFYGESILKQFMKMSQEFFEQDPLQGQNAYQAQKQFKDAGFHAVGIAPCADGRLAHMVSYVLRLPYKAVRRKSHAGSLFDISESVRNWVFIEHNRFRENQPNSANENTRYLKIAVYHYSKSDPLNQGCAAHGSDDTKAAQAALTKLQDFEQAIENRFGCGSKVQSLLMGINTDDDSLRVHVPDQVGNICLQRFVEANELFHQTKSMNLVQAKQQILQSIESCNATPRHNQHSQQCQNSQASHAMNQLLAWFIENNFSQIDFVNRYEKGCYADIGHAERFIGIGDGFEEVQLRNLTYYSFLHTVEEGLQDVSVGIKIFTGLNLNKGLPIPFIIRCDYDGRVPGSKDRALEKAQRINSALHERYKKLSQTGQLQTFCTLRDKLGNNPAEYIATRKN